MFVGREHELSELEQLYERDGFQMVVIYGRRRVGKTTLVSRFCESRPHLSFTARQQSDALNLRDFSQRVYEYFGLPASTGAFATWEDAFTFIARGAGSQRLVVAFDEFPYAAARCESLMSTLQVVIDHDLSRTNVFLILTGSNQGFMREKVLGQGDEAPGPGEENPLFGRRTAQINLMPFGYRDAARMLPGVAPKDQVTYYACLGGTPYYLSMVDASLGVERNLERLFFIKEGLLYEEPLMMMRQELREPSTYLSILGAIASGANRPQPIADRIGEERALVGKYLATLRSMGLVTKAAPYGENAARSRKGIYEISDPCFSFWFSFVEPNTEAVELDVGELAAREILGSQVLATHVGHWFERICLEWVVHQAKAGELPFVPIRFGRWWGSDPGARERADVDVVAGNPARKALLVGECKWRGEFDVSEAAEKLVARAPLVAEANEVWYALFSRQVLAGVTAERLRADAHWRLVDAEELYAGE